MNNGQMLLNTAQKVAGEKMEVVEGGPMDGLIVKSESGKAYNITVKNEEIIKCSCPHSHYRKTICKHMLKASIEKDMNIKALNIKSEKKSFINKLFSKLKSKIA
ncbi:MAG: SWIM zinc finger family protein [bacterium]